MGGPEGNGVSAETEYNLIVDELGAPGLVLWLALMIEVVMLLVRRLPRIENVDVRICLAGVFSVFLAHIAMGFDGAFTDSAAGAFIWFSVGIAAYWFAGPGRGELAVGRGEGAAVQTSAT